MANNREFTCNICGITKQPDSQFTTGYGRDKHDNKVCYLCCADQDKKQMMDEGKITLYLTESKSPLQGMKPEYVSNWPGTLRFPVYHSRKGRHNFARTRTDVWFQGPDGNEWWGVLYGEHTQLIHCRRTKG